MFINVYEVPNIVLVVYRFIMYIIIYYIFVFNCILYLYISIKYTVVVLHLHRYMNIECGVSVFKKKL